MGTPGLHFSVSLPTSLFQLLIQIGTNILPIHLTDYLLSLPNQSVPPFYRFPWRESNRYDNVTDSPLTDLPIGNTFVPIWLSVTPAT